MRRKDDPLAVGRDRRGSAIVECELRFGRRENGRLHDARGFAPQLDDSPGQRGSGQDQGCIQQPRQPFARFSPRCDRGGDTRLRSFASDPLQLLGNIVRALPPIARIFFQAALDDMLERRRRQRLNLRYRRRAAGDDRGDETRSRFAFEGAFACGHLVEQGAEGEDVRARVGFHAFELFGRHVLERADDRSFLGQGLLLRRAAEIDDRRGGFGQSEVEQLRSALGQHHVRRLQVAMDDALPVRLVQRFGDFNPVTEDLFGRHRTGGQPLSERLAFE